MPLFLHSKMFIILKLDESDQISFMHLVSTLPLVTLMSSQHAKSPPKKKICTTLRSPQTQRPLSFYRRQESKDLVSLGLMTHSETAPRRGRAVLQIDGAATAGPIRAAGCVSERGRDNVKDTQQ